MCSIRTSYRTLRDIPSDPSRSDWLGSVGISVIVAAELRFGTERVRSATLVDQIDTTLALLAILPFAVGCEDHYARIRSDLERRGTPIGANDLWIAAHALSIDATLVTDNVRAFERVGDLRVENWLR